MEYTIGSFNLCHFSYISTNSDRKNIYRIADIIVREEFDVVALQEVNSISALDKLLMSALGTGEWDYKWEEPRVYNSKYSEGYAYIWRKRRLRLVESGSNPKILSNYNLTRPPYYARFTPKGLLGGSNFELRLINTHIAFGIPKNNISTSSPRELRRTEFEILAEEAYRRVSSKRYGDFLPAYTILMGDYNLCLMGPGPKVNKIVPIDKDRYLLTVQKEKTTVKSPKSIDTFTDGEEQDIDLFQENDTDLYAHNYDHFSYELKLLEKIDLKDSRVEALGMYYGNNLEEYRKEISDHVPIKLKLNFNVPTTPTRLYFSNTLGISTEEN